MAIEFLQAGFPPLENLSVAAPDGAVIGIVGEDGAGKRSLLRLAAEAERAVETQRESAAHERKQKNEAYRAELARRSENRPELGRTVAESLSKGGA